jgi:hypothetical protein
MTERKIVRGVALVVVALLAGAALVGCVGIPRSGPVSVGESVSDGTISRDIEIRPQGPIKGANQQAIVSGFIAAFTGAANNYAVARQFLTSSMADKWDPRASVLIREGAAKPSELDERTIDYSFQSTAEVDVSGAYKQFLTESQNLRFRLVQVKKQWRISEAPDGIVLSDPTFHSIFNQYPLYFIDPESKYLVPDVRWFANGTAPTRIVTALLTGPPPWLQRAVRTAFPDGTKLSPGSVVSSESGVAVVDLTAEVASASSSEQQLMRLQLTASLSSVPSISKVTMSVDGTPLVIPDLNGGPQLDQGVVDAATLAMRGKEFGYLSNSGTKVTPIGSLSAKVEALEPSAATLSSSGAVAAVRSDAGVSLVRSGDQPTVVLDKRPGLVPPTMDESGYVWTVPTTNPNAIQITDFSGNAHTLPTAFEPGSRIESLDISRDGARVAILLDTDSGPRLVVSAIVRDPDQKLLPTSLGQAILNVSGESGMAIDATWYDEFSVATLTTVDGIPTVQVYEVGGGVTSLGDPGDAIAIVGGNGREGLRVLGADAEIRAYRGSSWQTAATKIAFIGTQRSSSR